jgi:adenylate cyclase
VGISAFLNSRATATDLSLQILRQASFRIDHQIDDLVHTGQRVTRLDQHALEEGLLSVGRPEQLVRFWVEVLESHTRVSAVYITVGADGYTLIVTRRKSGAIGIQELRAGPGGKFLLWNYTPQEYAYRQMLATPVAAARIAARLGASPALGPALTALAPGWRSPVEPPPGQQMDQRKWAWYRVPREKGGATWIDTYLFFNERGELSYPGVSFASPLRDGSGVIGLDFDVYSLCDYLAEIKVSRNGYAFVIEQGRGGQRRLIAHPDREILLDASPHATGNGRSELVALDQIRDPVVREFARQIPPSVSPVELKGMKPVRFEVDGVAYLGAFRGLEDPRPAPPWIICTVIPEEDVLEGAQRNNKHTFIIGMGVLALAIALSLIIAAQVARPLERLAEEAQAIGRLDLDRRCAAHSFIVEVDHLQTATDDMKASLRSFRKYIPADVVSKLLLSGQEAELGGERRRLTIYFSDIAGFTTIAETMEPETLVDHLGEYLAALSNQILATGGTVDKYIGDAIMAFWGAPQERDDHAVAACVAAVRNQQILARLRDKWAAEGKPLFHARIGINTGEVLVGNIGSTARINYTVIGDAVNLASRLEGLSKYYGTHTLITEMTFEEAKQAVVARPLDWVSVKGKANGVLVYELLGLKGETAPELEELAARFGEALGKYRGQDWAGAASLFETLLVRWPDDTPSREILERCKRYQEQPPGADWDGVHHMESK